MAVLQRHKSTIYGLVTDLNTLTQNISNEESARISADSALQTELNTTQTGAGLGTDGSYTANGSANYIASAISLQDADNDLDAQVKLNTDAIDALDTASSGDLSDEISARIAADAVLQADIDQNESDSDAADSAIQSELDTTQAGAGLNADGTYTANATANFITTSTTLQGADNDLDTALKAEATSRIAGDSTLQTNLDAEALARTNADSTLQGNIDDEETARIAADGVLTTAISDEETRALAAEALKVNLAGDTMGGNLDFADTYKISGLPTPTQDGDATNKVYVDSLISGIDWKQSVNVASDGALTLSGLQTVDGVLLEAGDRILVKNQASAVDNGIYVAVDGGAWTRALDFDDSPGTEVTGGNAVFVKEGTKYINTGWVLQGQGDLVVDTHELVFTQFTALGQIIAGAGIVKDGNELYLQFGAGVKELPNDEIGLDIYSASGLYMTEDGSTGSILTGAQLSIKLNDSDLELTGSGLAITSAFKSSVSSATATVQSNLDLEEAARIAGDNTLQTNIDNEETARIAADAILQGNIDAETSARTSADSALQDNIDAEALARTNADSALQAELDATQTGAGLGTGGLYTANTGADFIDSATSLQDADNKLDVALKAEETGRLAADVVLDGKIADLSGVTNAVTARSNIDVYSTTEVDNAIAAGGAVFVTETLTVASDAITLSEVAKSDMLFNFNTVRHTDANFVSYDIPATVSAGGSKVYNLSPNSSGEFDGLTVVVQYAYVPAA